VTQGSTRGKVCLITGASQGIGRATAVRLSREQWVRQLVLVSRSAAGLEETAKACGDGPAGVEVIAADLSDLDAIPGLVTRIHDAHGSIDVLCNIAGYADPKSLLDTSADNLVTTFTVNVFSMLILTREVVRAMQGRPAKILNIASTAGITARPGWVAYAASKAAVVSLSQTLSEELAGTGIKVYSISPGRTATELRRKLAPEEDPTTIMQPDAVADVIAMLVGEGERTLDGQNIIVRQQI
jgi:3-oxoacyl-[acyl-carrier protein] reductase